MQWTCTWPIWGNKHSHQIYVCNQFQALVIWEFIWHLFPFYRFSFHLTRSLIQILDSEMYDLMHAHGDYTHFYFCYRWFLLDFKRELVYTDIFLTWEMIWAAKQIASSHFVLFIALALLETYRDIILLNSMDFTDVIKFFNGKPPCLIHQIYVIYCSMLIYWCSITHCCFN